MKKKVVIVMFICLICEIVGYFLVMKFYVTHIIDKELELIDVPITTIELSQRSLINESLIEYIKVPKKYLPSDIVIELSDLDSKIVSNNGFIPKGSFIYESSLDNKSDINESPIFMLNKDQVVYSLQVDVVMLAANAISKNQKVDLFVTIENRGEEPVVDLLLSNVRVLAIKDHRGLELDDPLSNGIPHIVLLALNEEYVPLITKLVNIGRINLYSTDRSFMDDSECIINNESVIFEKIN